MSVASGEISSAIKFINYPKVEAVGFDMDGTLREKPKTWTQCAREVLANHGVIISKQQFEAFQGVGRIYSRWVNEYPQLEHLTPQDIGIEIERTYDFQTGCQVIPTPGSIAKVKEAAGHYPVVVITSGEKDDTWRALNKMGVAEKIDFVISQEDTPRGKPFSDPIDMAVQKLGINPRRFIYAGDTKADVDAAKAAGAVSVLLHRGNRRKVTLAKPHIGIVDLTEFRIKRLDAYVSKKRRS